jgi:hypothetical protein
VAEEPKKGKKPLSDGKIVCGTCGHVLGHTDMGFVVDDERASEVEELLLAMVMQQYRSCPVCNSTAIEIKPL